MKTNLPFGDIYFVGTPAIENAGKLLYNEEKQRQAQQAAANKALDDEFAKNVAGIRDADVNDLARVYGDYKMAAKNLMKQKGGGTPQQQLDLLRKKAEMYKTINESKAYKQYEDEMGKGVVSNPDAYEDNAHQILMRSRQTPLSQLGDLRNYDYRYKGTNTDFQKILKEAAGTPRQVYQKEEPQGALQFKITPYMYGNTPSQFKDSLLGALATRKAGRDAAAMVSQLDPKNILAVQEQYKAIPKEKWQQMGVSDPQDLTILPTDSKAEIFAKHQAQLYALNNEPKQGTPVFRRNEEAIDARNFAQQKELAALQNQYAMSRQRLNDQLVRGRMALRAAKSAQDQDNVLNQFINDQYENGTNEYGGKVITHIVIDGKKYEGKIVDVPKVLKDKYIRDVSTEKDAYAIKKEPDAWYMTNDKKKIVPLYLGDKTVTGGNIIKAGSKPIDIQNYKTELLPILNKKGASDVVEDIDPEEDFQISSAPAAIKQSKPEKITISPDEWNKQWSKLKKGQSMVGLDGKTYIKQ